ncbi:meiotic recombination protein SPO11 [Exophiala viscosa]|uniref:meiotic recombination protein SPO11 n=1 Tax=Exophiala viscosa TaxID=2486360 RepID=UPI0021A08F14|nr:meiotic recombination protein SPO11 [Exophiala viscosa]
MDFIRPQNDLSSLPPEPLTTAGNRKVLAYIETTFNHILHEIQIRPCGKPVIVLRRIVSVRPYHDENDLNRLKWHIEDREVTYSFPAKTKDEAWRFACVGQILAAIYSAIKDGITVTKRDIYYQDPALFKQQETVDRYIDDIAHTCQVTRSDLNVIGSPKGLLVGLDPDANDRMAIVPAVNNIETSMRLSHLNWILVVEKEATFNALVERKFHLNSINGPGLLVTAKGYPDLATRHFLRFVLDHSETPLPIFCLIDWDPDGIQILKCYLYGSKNLAREHVCNIPELKWLGLKADDVAPGDGVQISMPLSMRDRVIALSMLTSQEWRDGSDISLPGLVDAMNELRRMLMLNRKAEIQSLDDREGGLERWLTNRLAIELHDDSIVH